MNAIKLGVASLVGTLWLAGCGSGGLAPSGPEGRVEVAVAPLSLNGITDATYTLRVVNGQGELVWERTVTSSRYGDGAGSVSYLGPCDASSTAASNRIQVVLDALSDASGPLVEGTDFVNPAPASAPLEREFTCVADGDVAVTFDITFARAAKQGFFDVAVELVDVYCSAKLDCQEEDGSPLRLLHNNGVRDATAVLALSCTGGLGADTWLYMSDITLTCPDGDTVVDPSLGPGRLSIVSGSGLPDAHLYDALVSRGAEQLGSWGKQYWTIALGLDNVTGCTLEANATASDGILSGGVTPSGAIWPVIHWSSSLDSCTRHEVNGADGVVFTSYTGFEGASFAHVFSGTGIPITGSGEASSPARFDDGYTPTSCEGYRDPSPPHVYAGTTGDGYYVIDPLGDGTPVTVLCDMTSDGGGWTRVFTHEQTTKVNVVEQSALNAGLAAAATGNGTPQRSALQTWRAAGGFSTLRFECQKVSPKPQGAPVPRAIDIATSDAASLDFLIGAAPGYPSAVGKIQVLEGDSSILGGSAQGSQTTGDGAPTTRSGPADWGRVGTTYFTGTWGHEGMAASLYDHTFFIGWTTHWNLRPNERSECDDYVPSPTSSAEDNAGYWYIWVR